MARAPKRNHFVGIPRHNSQATSDAISENIEVLIGERGDGQYRAILYKDLIDFDRLRRQALIDNLSHPNDGGGLPIPPMGDVERPHAPVNLAGLGGFTFITLTWDHPTYRGHAYAEIFRSEQDAFNSAIKIATEVTDIFTDNVDLNSAYYYWVRFVNIADMKGPTQGANGLLVVTQDSAEKILDEIGGQIEASHLGVFLRETIENIEGNTEFEEDIAQTLIEEALSNDVNAGMSRERHALVIEKQRTLVTDQEALAEKQTVLAAGINDLASTLSINYLTKVQTHSAISQAITTLNSSIQQDIVSGDNTVKASINATLQTNYLTKTATNNAISQAITTLNATIQGDIDAGDTSVINSVTANLQTHYLTKAQTNSAISQAITTLNSSIQGDIATGDSNVVNSINATLQHHYFTQAQTNGAIAQASTTLKAQIESPNGDSVGAQLQTLSQTVANNNDDVWALWGVKTTVNGLTSSIGLVNDGVDPIFAVKGAKLAVITNQDPNDLTPVFAVVGNKTVIKSALIDTAFIQSLVTDNLLANRLLVGSRLLTPSINYDPATGARSSNFSIDPNGNLVAKNADIHGHINAISGRFVGEVRASSGRFTNVLIDETCDVKGTIYAHKIVGDLVGAKAINMIEKNVINSSWQTLATWSIQADPIQRRHFSIQSVLGSVFVSRNAEDGWKSASIRFRLVRGSNVMQTTPETRVYEGYDFNKGGESSAVANVSMTSPIDINQAVTMTLQVYGEIHGSSGGPISQVKVSAQQIVGLLFRQGGQFND